MRFISLLIFIAVASHFSSCTSKAEKQEAETIRYATNQIFEYRRQLQESNKLIYAALEEMTNEYTTRERALQQLAVAEKIAKLSDETVQSMQSIIAAGRMMYIEELLAKTRTFKDSLTRIGFWTDEPVSSQIRQFPFTEKDAAQNVANSTSWNELSPQHQKLMFDLFINQTRILENKLLELCIDKLGSTRGPCVFDMPITGQSSTTLSKGEKFSIDAAIGVIREMPEQKVTIAGTSLQQNENGTFKYESFAPTKEGIFSVPVVFEYIDQDGRKIKMSKSIQFTVK